MSQSIPSELWYTRCPVPTTSGIAQHFRWLHNEFDRNGIALESIRASADRAVRNSHYDHTHPNMFREGGNVPPLWARANGRDTAVVGITWVDEEQLILVRGDSDITDISQLKGRRLGLPKHKSQIVDIGRSQDLRGLLTALELAKIGRDEVTFVDLEGGEFDLREQGDRQERQHLGAAALLAGTADAIYAKGAVGATLVAEHGFRPLLDINAHPDPFVRVNAGTPRPITVDRRLAEENPEVVARYLAVLLRTAEWAAQNREDVVRAVAAETGASIDAVLRGFGSRLHLSLTPLLSEQYVKGLGLQKAFLLREGFLAADFDYDAWIVREPLALAARLVDQVAFPPRARAEAAE
jgi:ABC-type nitrate/sulfonate/bicarbonate transport system substrate-binding protein